MSLWREVLETEEEVNLEPDSNHFLQLLLPVLLVRKPGHYLRHHPHRYKKHVSLVSLLLYR